jgi:endonuclease/exonuclease/phosphatase family metal-dependent hydrolase
MTAALIFFGAIVAGVMCILVIIRLRQPRFGILQGQGPTDGLCNARHEISVLAWNIGYGALGQQADFFVDHGQSVRALPPKDIANSASRIADILSAGAWDVICLQENAAAGFLTRAVPVRRMIDRALPAMRHYYWADLKTVLLPKPLRFDHGMSTYTALKDTGCEILKLPQDRKYYGHFLKKFYAGQLSRYPIEGSDKNWVIINIHLSPADPGGTVRNAQLQGLMAVAQREFAQSNYVVLGGDWNLRMCQTEFSHTTDQASLEWSRNFPQGSLPAGWRIFCDPDTPTVRSLEKAYQEGQNYTTVIDGFIGSPNVALKSIKTTDLRFEITDHHPVEAVFITDT